MAGLEDFLFGTQQRFEQVPTSTGGQQNIIQQLIAGLSGGGFGGGPLGSGLQNLQGILSGDPEALKAFEAPARTAFEQQTLPAIAERFTAAGGQRSGAFTQALGAAGAGLEENLSAQRAQLQSGALSQLQSLLGTSQQSQFQNENIPATSGFLQSLLAALGKVGGAGLTGGLGGLASGIGFGSGFGQGLGVS